MISIQGMLELPRRPVSTEGIVELLSTEGMMESPVTAPKAQG